jgi:hypothetical protein
MEKLILVWNAFSMKLKEILLKLKMNELWIEIKAKKYSEKIYIIYP